jgi:PAS domain S-box-containing protein
MADNEKAERTLMSTWPGRVSCAAGFVAIVVSCSVFVGWTFDVEVLKRIFPGLVAMNPATACGFVLAGLSLLLCGDAQPASGSRRLAHSFALLVAVLGMIKLGDYFGLYELNIDRQLFRHKLGENGMAPNTALNFVLVGCALLLLDVETRRRHRPAEFLALATGLISLLAVLGYAYNVKYLYRITGFIPMALHTATTFLVLALGILAARADRGLMAIALADSDGGVLFRRMLPAAVLLLATLGWLRLEGERRGLYGTEFGVALYTASAIALFSGLIWFSAWVLHRIDTERRRAVADLDRLFAMSVDMLCVAGTDGYFKRLNPAFEKTLGYSNAALLSTPFLEFVHPEDRAATVAEVEKLASGVPTMCFENRYRCKDGSYKWLAWSSNPVVEEGLLFATARDMTEQKRAEHVSKTLNDSVRRYALQLQAANKELEAFSYSVSHDLRAPLRSIDGFSKALLEDYGDKLDATGQDFLCRIRAAAQKMGHLIDGLLNLSRVTRAEMRTEPVDLSAMARAAAEELRRREPDRQVEFAIADGLTTNGDARLLGVVLDNLLENAWKFSAQKSQAQIEFGCRNGEAAAERVFFVRDNGAGFDMAYASKLFGAFQRFHSAEQFPGTGIGLATVQRIVNRHGGRVWAEGEVGKGATFYFTLEQTGEK